MRVMVIVNIAYYSTRKTAAKELYIHGRDRPFQRDCHHRRRLAQELPRLSGRSNVASEGQIISPLPCLPLETPPAQQAKLLVGKNLPVRTCQGGSTEQLRMRISHCTDDSCLGEPS